MSLFGAPHCTELEQIMVYYECVVYLIQLNKLQDEFQADLFYMHVDIGKTRSQEQLRVDFKDQVKYHVKCCMVFVAYINILCYNLYLSNIILIS